MENYFQQVPSELITIIISYIKDFPDLDTFQETFTPRIDWVNLFILNYSEYYHVNLKNYRIKYVYYDFILQKSKIEIHLLHFKETARYLLLNDIIKTNRGDHIDNIFMYDDIEIYKVYQNQLLGVKIKTLIACCLDYTAINILRYIMVTSNLTPTELFNEMINYIKLRDYNNIDSYKRVLTCINFGDLKPELSIKLLELNKKDQDIFDYTLKLFSSNINLQDILNFQHSLVNRLKRNQVNIYYFKKFYNKYKIIFDNNYINV